MSRRFSLPGWALATATIALATAATARAAEKADAPQSTVADGPVRLSVHAEPGTLRVAEPLRLVLQVEAPRGTRIQWPPLAGQLGAFEVRDVATTDDLPIDPDGAARRWRLTAELETLETGELVIPPLDVHYAAGDDRSTFHTLRSEPVAVRIVSVLEDRADATAFRDIKQPVDIAVAEATSWAWLGWTAGGAGALAVAALLAVAVARRRRGPAPARWARAAMAELEQRSHAGHDPAEAIFHELIDLLREFFELEFGMPTFARTSREFLADAADEVGLGTTERDRLAWLAGLADQVKFARGGIDREQLRQALAHARSFVDQCARHRLAVEKESA